MKSLQRLLGIMEQLRHPETGCPWDIKQTFQSIVPHTIEEAYEVADAITQGRPDAIKDELGDLLFQVVFYAQLGKEKDWFDFEDIAGAVSDKLERRHPHVFGKSDITTSDQVKEQWEQIKKQERAGKDEAASVFNDIPNNLPALLQALKVQKRCRSVGFDWDDIADVSAKVQEEVDEVNAELAADVPDTTRVEEEVGDLLFAVVNLARHAKVNPENALRSANLKFMRRFRFIEQAVREQNKDLEDFSLEQFEDLWQQAKQR